MLHVCQLSALARAAKSYRLHHHVPIFHILLLGALFERILYPLLWGYTHIVHLMAFPSLTLESKSRNASDALQNLSLLVTVCIHSSRSIDPFPLVSIVSKALDKDPNVWV